ncbi:RING-H2 finger protein atl2 [Phtheirospermum japonicum]|uniref:RING-type E3 ubiquitin transferase n=1 Tax=Phtheirospermum japonicum TaxID=374723 RepID=A0A830CU74_9LAMI|nr:RING-H2 finger protein atl2 [Phtheirospermum japonicum]
MNKEKLMTLTVALLFLAWFLVVLFHVYTRYCGRRPADSLRHHAATWATVSCSRGLDFSAVNALPTFVYESKSGEPPLECAVCLSDFEVCETGRVMPECKHCFHIECIDMWLQSHCECPLCRTRVSVPGTCDPVEPVENSRSIPVSVPATGWRSGIYTFLLSQ